jgi:hypothetical protein
VFIKRVSAGNETRLAEIRNLKPGEFAMVDRKAGSTLEHAGAMKHYQRIAKRLSKRSCRRYTVRRPANVSLRSREIWIKRVA